MLLRRSAGQIFDNGMAIKQAVVYSRRADTSVAKRIQKAGTLLPLSGYGLYPGKTLIYKLAKTIKGQAIM